jgi:hypothetical protein
MSDGMNPTKPVLGLLIAGGVLLAAGLASPGRAEDFFDAADPQPAATAPARRSDRFRRYAQAIGRYYAPFEGGYVCVPGYDPRYPSSRGMTLTEAIVKLTRTEESGGGVVVQRTAIRPDRAEAQALAMALPRLAVGQYGWVRGATVDQVVGPTDMVLKDLTLIDRESLDRAKADAKDRGTGASRDTTSSYDEAERYRDEIYSGGSGGGGSSRRASRRTGMSTEEVARRFRERDALVERQSSREFKARFLLRGVATARLARGGAWPAGEDQAGLQVAIIRTTADPKAATARRSAPPARLFEAVPLTALQFGLTEDQFADLLRRRGFEEEAFLDMAQEEVRKDPQGGVAKVLDALESRRKDAPAAEPATQPAPGDTPTTRPAKPKRWQDM